MDILRVNAYQIAQAHEQDMPIIETNRTKIVARLAREGWIVRQDGGHDIYKHPDRKGRIPVPRHRELSIGVAKSIAKEAGWI